MEPAAASARAFSRGRGAGLRRPPVFAFTDPKGIRRISEALNDLRAACASNSGATARTRPKGMISPLQRNHIGRVRHPTLYDVGVDLASGEEEG